MVSPEHLRRLTLFTVLLCLGFVGLGGMLVYIHVLRHEYYTNLANNHTLRIFLKEPRRGDILDAQGHPLATSFPVKKLFADPALMGPYYPDVARTVAPLMGYRDDELAERLRPTIVRTNSNGTLVTNAYVNLRRKLTVEQWDRVTEAMAGLRFPIEATNLRRGQRAFFRNLRMHAIYAVDDYQREYPSGALAAHALGFTREIDQEFSGFWVTEVRGVDGVERWMDAKLRGVRGWVVTETDRRKREVVMHREQNVDPRPGLNVVLTIDMVIQNILETELAEAMKTYDPESAVSIAVRPRTGEILGLAVLPNYDPNNLGATPTNHFDHFRNRAITDRIEPGSTFKIVVVAGGLNEKVVTLEDQIFCENGYWTYLGKPLRDHGAYGWLTVQKIITKSSNIGAAKIGLRLGEQRLYHYARSFGFGVPTGIPLPGEVGGLLLPCKNWDRLAITRIPMGHAVDVTPLQMAMAMAAIANDGVLMKPMLIRELRDADGQTVAQYQPVQVGRVINSQAAKDAVAALKTVPTKEGTAIKAALDYYTVAGKTGTAQVPNGRWGYLDGIYVSSFCGFFPADSPELCIYVMLNKVDRAKGGYYGSQVAAPVFKRIAEQCAQHLKIRPDKADSLDEALASAHNAGAATIPSRTP
jgi:cell division protein FtsI/penicillin-binding protein 2